MLTPPSLVTQGWDCRPTNTPRSLYPNYARPVGANEASAPHEGRGLPKTSRTSDSIRLLIQAGDEKGGRAGRPPDESTSGQPRRPDGAPNNQKSPRRSDSASLRDPPRDMGSTRIMLIQ